MSSDLLNNISIILVSPQMGENIGATARVMKNFGITDLRIVSPRDGWPNPKAVDMSANARDVIDSAKIYKNVEDAVLDLDYLVATTARPRYMVKEVITPEESSKKISLNKKSGIMFGAEASGLTNKSISYCNEIVSIPVSNIYTSINISQSVGILCYEIFKNNSDNKNKISKNKYANKKELNNLINFLESKLSKRNFFQEENKKETMKINIRNIFTKNNYTDQEIKTLKGIFSLMEKI